MPKQVNHHDRRREILRKSLLLFQELGYDQVTYQQISEVCGLSRTALYKYFATKRDIFDNALTQCVTDISAEVLALLQENPKASCSQKLNILLTRSIELCQKKTDLFRAIFEYLDTQARQGENVREKVRRHLAPFQLALRNLIQQGINKGEFIKVDVSQVEDMLLALVQASAVRTLFYAPDDCNPLLHHAHAILQALRGDPV